MSFPIPNPSSLAVAHPFLLLEEERRELPVAIFDAASASTSSGGGLAVRPNAVL